MNAERKAESGWNPTDTTVGCDWCGECEWCADLGAPDDCQHEWELRSEHDLWICAWCQAEVTYPPTVDGGDHS